MSEPMLGQPLKEGEADLKQRRQERRDAADCIVIERGVRYSEDGLRPGSGQSTPQEHDQDGVQHRNISVQTEEVTGFFISSFLAGVYIGYRQPN
ncbi:MAG: hypothetical protein FWH40_08830 [Coriobacteriia bacterium]|nr:hypothetical protein [Coriobacteriia bacterium]